MKSNLIFLASIFSSSVLGDEYEEPQFKLMENWLMETPITKKEYDNWGTYGSSVFMKDKIVLNPEVKDSKGGIHNTNFTSDGGNWIAEMKLHIGNTDKTSKGGNGVGIHFL
jgi:hypothetical protein